MVTFQLRAGVEIVHDDDGRPAELRDAVLDRRIHLGVITAAIIGALGEQQPWNEVGDRVAREHRRPRGEVDRMLRKLLWLGALEGSAAQIVAKMTAVRAEGLRPVALAGSQFACQGSGACCQNHRLGPLSNEDLTGLARLDLARAFPELAPGPYHEEREREGERVRYLKAKNGRCVFLAADQRCGLHAHFGAEAKPDFCRRFPLEELPTIDGLRQYDKGACSCFAVSARSGAPIATLLPLGKRPEPKIYHPVVRLDDGVQVDYGVYLRFTSAAIDLVERREPGGAPVALATLGAAIGGFRDALESCPLAIGEPDATVEAFLAPGLARFAPHPAEGETRDGAEMLTVVLGDLIEALDGTGDEHGLGAPLVAEALALLRTGYRLAARVADPSYPLTADEEAMQAIGGVDDEDVDDVLRLSLRQQLFGYRSLIADRPLPALARMAIIQLAATWGARRAAAARGATRVIATDLSAGHSLAARVLETSATSLVLLQHEDLLAGMLAALPLVVGNL